MTTTPEPADPVEPTRHADPLPAGARVSLPREIWVLVAAAVVIAMGYGLVAPVLPQFARSFDVSVAAASTVVSAFAFMRLVFAPAGGALIGRLGERPVYLTGLVLVALSTGATGLAQSYGQLLVFRGLGGIGSTMFTVSAMGLIVRLAPPSARGRASALYGTAFLLGNIGGPVLGGLLAEAGLRVPFFVYAVALLIAAGIVAVLLRAPGTRARGGAAPPAVLSVREALAVPAYRAVLVSGFANGWTNFGVRIALLPLFAAAALEAGPWAAGAALAVFAAGDFVSLRFSGRLTDTRGRKPLVVAGLVVSGVFTAVLGLSGEIWLVLAASALAGVGAGLLTPGQQATVADVVGSDRNGGKVLAAFQMCQDAGAIVGPVLAGVVADTAGYGAAFALSGGLMIVAALAWAPAADTLPTARGVGRR